MIAQLIDLSIGYKKGKNEANVLLYAVNQVISKGSLIALFGSNGVGKSTLLKTIAGLEPPLAGKVHICEKDLAGLDARSCARLVSVVMPLTADTDRLTVGELVALGRYPYTGLSGRLSEQDDERIIASLQLVNMAAFADRTFMNLSDGERQKVLIAKALAQDCPLLLMDEPTAYLDIRNKPAVLKLLKYLCETTGISVLMSTHDVEQALKYVHKVWLMPGDNTIVNYLPGDEALKAQLSDIFEV